MTKKVTKKELEEALETYANLVEIYPDNESYLRRYAKMLLTLGREATATAVLQHLHDVIAKRSSEEARQFAKEHPQIGRISLDDIVFDGHDKHAIAGEIITELLGKIWLHLHRKAYKEGQIIHHSHDFSDSITLVLDGKVDAYTVKADNIRTLVESIGIQDIIGENTFFHPGEIKVDVITSSEKATIVSIPRQKLLDMIDNNPYLKKMLSQRALFRANIHAIAKCEVFRTMPLKLSKYLARSLILREYSPGSLIQTIGQPLEGAEIVLAGDICHVVKDSAGNKTLLPPLNSTYVIGDITLEGKKATSRAELVAKTTVSLAHIPYAQLLNVSLVFPVLKERLNQLAALQQAQLMQWLSTANYE